MAVRFGFSLGFAAFLATLANFLASRGKLSVFDELPPSPEDRPRQIKIPTL